MPPLRYFHQLLTQQGTPAEVHYIRGKATGNFNFSLDIVDARQQVSTVTFSVSIDANGNFECQYTGKIYSAKKAFLSNTLITEIEFDEDFAECVTTEQMFNAMTKVAAISLPNATFAAALNTSYMFGQFNNLNVLQSISMPSANFASTTNTFFMFAGLTHLTHAITLNETFAYVTNASRMFMDSIFDLSMPNATFELATDCSEMFSGFKGSLSLPSVTFAAATNITKLFLNHTGTSISLPNATFEHVTTATQAFNLLPNATIIDLPSATFERVTTANALFSQYNHVALTTIYMPNATFESLQSGGNNANLFGANFTRTLQNFTVAANKLKVSMNMSGPNLTYQSFLNVANWCADLTGQTAQTIAFYSVAWNALTAAEQSNIDTILSGKNWTRAIA